MDIYNNFFLHDNKLSVNLIEQYKDKIDWNKFTYYYSDYINKEILIKYSKYLNYNIIYDKLNGKIYNWLSNELHDRSTNILDIHYQFIKLFQDNILWIIICRHQILNENFIILFQDNVLWSYISKYQKLSENFIRV